MLTPNTTTILPCLDMFPTDNSDLFPSSLSSGGTDGVELAADIVASLTLAAVWTVGMVGNALACVVVYRSRRLQSTTNFFVVSLAWADITLALLVMPFILAQVVTDHWPFSTLSLTGDGAGSGAVGLCQFVKFLQYLVPASNDFVLVAIAIDRFYTILEPLRFTVTRGRARRMVMAAWLGAAVIASPACYFYNVVETIPGGSGVGGGYESSGGSGEVICAPYVRNTTSSVAYVIVVFVVVIVLPALLTTVLYVRVARFIWRVGIGGHPFLQRTTNSVPRAKVKMVKMLMLLTALTFAITAPYFIVQIVQCAVPDYPNYYYDIDMALYIAVTWLYFGSAASKPSLYIFLNSNFRRGCKEVFCLSWMRCCRRHAYIVTTTSSIAKKNYVGVTSQMTSISAVGYPPPPPPQAAPLGPVVNPGRRTRGEFGPAVGGGVPDPPSTNNVGLRPAKSTAMTRDPAPGLILAPIPAVARPRARPPTLTATCVPTLAASLVPSQLEWHQKLQQQQQHQQQEQQQE